LKDRRLLRLGTYWLLNPISFGNRWIDTLRIGWSKLFLLGGPKRYPGRLFLFHFVATVATIMADAADVCRHVLGRVFADSMGRFLSSESSLSAPSSDDLKIII